jgi:hypothetical protein
MQHMAPLRGQYHVSWDREGTHAAAIFAYSAQFVGLGGILASWRMESKLGMTQDNETEAILCESRNLGLFSACPGSPSFNDDIQYGSRQLRPAKKLECVAVQVWRKEERTQQSKRGSACSRTDEGLGTAVEWYF